MREYDRTLLKVKQLRKYWGILPSSSVPGLTILACAVHPGTFWSANSHLIIWVLPHSKSPRSVCNCKQNISGGGAINLSGSYIWNLNVFYNHWSSRVCIFLFKFQILINASTIAIHSGTTGRPLPRNPRSEIFCSQSAISFYTLLFTQNVGMLYDP